MDKQKQWYIVNERVIENIIDKVIRSLSKYNWSDTIDYDIKFNITKIRNNLITFLYESKSIA